jgi:hypothetical protein
MDPMTVLAGISILVVLGLRVYSTKKREHEDEPPQSRPINEDASAFGGTDLGDFGLSEREVIRQPYKTPEESPKPEPIIIVFKTPDAHGALFLARIREEEDRRARTIERPTPPIIVVDDEVRAPMHPERFLRRIPRMRPTGTVVLKNGATLPCTVVHQCTNGSIIIDTPRGTMRKKKRYVRTGA